MEVRIKKQKNNNGRYCDTKKKFKQRSIINKIKNFKEVAII